MAQQWVCKACKPGFVKDGADFKPSAQPKGGGGGGRVPAHGQEGQALDGGGRDESEDPHPTYSTFAP